MKNNMEGLKAVLHGINAAKVRTLLKLQGRGLFICELKTVGDPAELVREIRDYTLERSLEAGVGVYDGNRVLLFNSLLEKVGPFRRGSTPRWERTGG